jgi:polyhydroxyalkanoate synthesis regulator phasin
MVGESLRGYLSLASGLSEVTAARARAAARALVEQGEATAGQVSSLAEDLMSTSRRNRESMALLIRHEVDQAVRRLGLASAAENDELTRRVRQLERTVRELQAGQHTGSPGGQRASTTASGASGSGKERSSSGSAARNGSRPATKPAKTKTATSPRTKRTAPGAMAKKTAAKKTAKRGAAAKKATKSASATKRAATRTAKRTKATKAAKKRT